jgi:hypothetical protein
LSFSGEDGQAYNIFIQNGFKDSQNPGQWTTEFQSDDPFYYYPTYGLPSNTWSDTGALGAFTIGNIF